MPLHNAYIVPHPPLIIPQVGKGKEELIRDTIDAYHTIARSIAEKKPRTIIITTPHGTIYSDYLHISPGNSARGSLSAFGAPQVEFSVKYDQSLAETITGYAQKQNIMAGTSGEQLRTLDHATMVPLYFIDQYYKDYQILRISISGLSPLIHYQFGQCIAKAITDSKKDVVLVASGDLSHKLKEDGPYGYAPEGPLFDQELTQAISDADFMRLLTFDESFCEAAGECGLRSFLIMAGAMDGKSVDAKLLSYQGPFGVGYAVASFAVGADDDSRCFANTFTASQEEKAARLKEKADPFVRLARQSLEHYLVHNTRLKKPADLPEEMTNQKAGVFVSLKMDGRLRGCIGTIMPTTADIASEIIQNAISAGLDDPRFEPVSQEELPRLVISVDVLGRAEPISSISELDVKKYGVIVSSRGRRGLLLPNLEGIDSPKQQVDIALQKAGISPKEPYSMERFVVVRHL